MAQTKIVQNARHKAADHSVIDGIDVEKLETPEALNSSAEGAFNGLSSPTMLPIISALHSGQVAMVLVWRQEIPLVGVRRVSDQKEVRSDYVLRSLNEKLSKQILKLRLVIS